MPSSINASTTAGLVNTADTSGVLNIQTAGVTAISINASQAVSFTNSPTVTGGTANGVAYLNGSKVLTTGTTVVFDGTNFGIGTTTPDALLHVNKASAKVATFGNNVNNNGNYIVLGGTVSTKNWVLANNMIVGGEFGVGRTSANGGTTIGSAYDLMIDTNGGVKVANTLGVGYTTPSTSGAGITFPATQSASTDANTLDDYEEGTWTPTLITTGTNFTSVTYNAVTSGKYTKIGNMVYVQGVLDTSAVTKGSASGFPLIGGLPFAKASDNQFGMFAAMQRSGWITNVPNTGIVSGSIIYLQYTTAANGATSYSAIADVSTTSNIIYFGACYNV